MSDKWEELSEALTNEIKREIAQNYFSEKLLIEEEWQEFENELGRLVKLQRELFDLSWGVKLLLQEKELIQRFERITGFPVEEVCNFSKKVLPKRYETSQKELVKEVFKQLFSPFCITKKGKAGKLLIALYRRLYQVVQKYHEERKKMQKFYEILKDKTDEFHKKYDLSYILSFFHKLESHPEEVMTPEEKEKIWEELNKKLRVAIPEAVEKRFKEFKNLKTPSEVYLSLFFLGRKAAKANPEILEEILRVVH